MSMDTKIEIQRMKSEDAQRARDHELKLLQMKIQLAQIQRGQPVIRTPSDEDLDDDEPQRQLLAAMGLS